MSKTHTTNPDFNPSGKEVVDNIKEWTENLVDYINDNCPDVRQRTRALDKLEDASMLAVKSLFVK